MIRPPNNRVFSESKEGARSRISSALTQRWGGRNSATTRGLATLVERSLAPLDSLRAWLLHALGPRWCRALIVPREARVALVGSLLGLVALAAAGLAPLWLIGLGPLVLGVPHVVSDVRYLLVRPGFHRRRALMAVIALAMIGAGLGLRLAGGLLAVAGALVLARAGWRRKAAGLAVTAVALAVVVHAGWFADAVFLQLHNAVALVWWWFWRPRKGRLHWLPLAVFAGGAALVMLGALDGLVIARGAYDSPWRDIDVASLGPALAPFAHGQWVLRFVLLYAFGQSVHYIVWLRLVPDEDRRAPTPRTFRRTYRALIDDLGPWLVVLAAATTAVFVAWAFVSVAGARSAYLEVGFFHTYLEIVVLALFWAESRFGEASASDVRPRSAA